MRPLVTTTGRDEPYMVTHMNNPLLRDPIYSFSLQRVRFEPIPYIALIISDEPGTPHARLSTYEIDGRDT